jgi:hypothetical protein
VGTTHRIPEKATRYKVKMNREEAWNDQQRNLSERQGKRQRKTGKEEK